MLKFLKKGKKVVLKFFRQMCSGEFFLKHVLKSRVCKDVEYSRETICIQRTCILRSCFSTVTAWSICACCMTVVRLLFHCLIFCFEVTHSLSLFFSARRF